MQDIVLCSQLTSRHGLLVGLTETKKTVTLIYEQSVDRNSAFEMLQNPSGRTSKKCQTSRICKTASQGTVTSNR